MRQITRVMVAAISVLTMLLVVAGPASAQDPTDVIDGYESVAVDGEVSGPTAQEPDPEVEGAQETNDPDLAFTGTEINVPVAVGAVLIGFGGLLSLAANKRRRQLI